MIVPADLLGGLVVATRLYFDKKNLGASDDVSRGVCQLFQLFSLTLCDGSNLCLKRFHSIRCTQLAVPVCNARQQPVQLSGNAGCQCSRRPNLRQLNISDAGEKSMLKQ